MATATAEMIFRIRADGSNVKAVVADIEKQFTKLGGGAVTGLQSGFKAAASEASNLVGIFTGNRLSGATSQLTSFAGAISAIPGAAGLALGALAALGTAAVGVGTAMFEAT